jgi:hypothetical protein
VAVDGRRLRAAGTSGEPRGSNAHLIPKAYTKETTSPLTIEVAAGENELPPIVLN